MKKILINATQPEELRVALVDGKKLQDLDIESKSSPQKKDNIYKGVVTQIEHSLEAAFIEYGEERHGFLPFKNILPEYFERNASQGSTDKGSIRKGQSVLVQIARDERGNKGALFTTKISLVGHYIVFMPNSSKSGGVSRQAKQNERTNARKILEQLDCKKNESVIVRANGIHRSVEEIQTELNSLRSLWHKIKESEKMADGPRLLYQESGIMIRAIRDHFHKDIDELIIDNEKTYNEALKIARLNNPDNVDKIKLHDDPVPLFNLYQIENQINQAYEREVSMPSGGTLVFDHTEALLSIDINSAKHTRRSDIEETALSVNLEACDEIARQLKLRDIGGLIAIDFIDMATPQNRDKVEQKLEQCLTHDRARTRTGSISEFGILEMSRQRLHISLGESSHIVCPHCEGVGVVRTPQSAALAALRVLEDNAIKVKTTNIYVRMPIEMLEFLINEKRSEISEIEERHKIHIVLINDRSLQVPHFKMICQQKDEPKPTKQLLEHKDEQKTSVMEEMRKKSLLEQKPMISRMEHLFASIPKDTSILKTITGIFSFFTKDKSKKSKEQQSEHKPNRPRNSRRRRSSSSSASSSSSKSHTRNKERRGGRQYSDNNNGERRRRSGRNRSGEKFERSNNKNDEHGKTTQNTRRSEEDLAQKTDNVLKKRESSPHREHAASENNTTPAKIKTTVAPRPEPEQKANEEKVKVTPVDDVLRNLTTGESNLVQIQTTKKVSGNDD